MRLCLCIVTTLFALLLLLTVAGCSSGGGGSRLSPGMASAMITVKWPPRPARDATLTLSATIQSVEIDVTAADGTSDHQILNRPVSSVGPQVSTAAFFGLSTGQTTFTATAYKGLDGSGDTLSHGTFTLPIGLGANAVVLVMQSTIATIEIAPSPITVAVKQVAYPTSITAKDAQGNPILVLSDLTNDANWLADLTWTTADPTIATVASDGAITGVSAGTTQITVKDKSSGVTATVPVNVVALTILNPTVSPATLDFTGGQISINADVSTLQSVTRVWAVISQDPASSPVITLTAPVTVEMTNASNYFVRRATRASTTYTGFWTAPPNPDQNTANAKRQAIYQVQINATDSSGATAQSNPVSVTVNAADAPPASPL